MSRAWASASLGRLGELDAAGLAAAAREHLGLDDDRAAELRGGVRGFRGRRGEPSFGDGDAEVAKELLALVLVEIHAGRESTPVYPSGTIDKGGTMSVAKIVELTATGDTSRTPSRTASRRHRRLCATSSMCTSTRSRRIAKTAGSPRTTCT